VEADEGRANVGGGKLALAVNSLVGVRGLGVNAVVLDDILERIVHQAAVAALVALSLRAIDEVLFRERDEVACGKSVSTLGGAGG